MTSSFDEAEIYIKEVLSMPIELAVKDLNEELVDDNTVPGLKLLVTGGQAIQAYFPHSKPIRTHDYDLKLVAKKSTLYTPRVRNRMVLLAKGIARFIAIRLNEYMDGILDKVRNEIKSQWGLELLTNKNNEVFYASTSPRLELLNTVRFKLRGKRSTRTNSIADVYVVDPDEVYHYHAFTGESSISNPILSKDTGDYYIPHHDINGIPYAALGYIIWDTIRMVRESEAAQNPKYPRYKAKRDAIFQALNTPQAKLSCNAMKNYMLSCEEKYTTCTIGDEKFQTVNSLLQYGLEEGIIPSDPNLIKRIQKTYDINYLCQSLKRIVEG